MQGQTCFNEQSNVTERNLYATKLAEAGFVTLALDLPFWDASSGSPRNSVAPDLYAEAFSAAVDYLGSGAQDITAGKRSILTSGTPEILTSTSSAVDREFFDFYRTSRGHTVKFMNFYPFSDIENIAPQPLLFISGDRALSWEFSEDAFARARQPKECIG
ncbi:hypothetical protein BDW74DRAFT_172315 [Aspergillus multicolor]|uniref:alpha/beta hydrolase n=1 Tax=Aspergillus multicolor TaxID=41759 RepID=UPI003CCD8CAB